MPSTSARRVVVVATVVCALTGIVPGSASAGSYTVRTCNAAPGIFSTQAFGDFATRGMRIRRACDPEGPGRRGLLVGNVPRRGRVAFAARSILTLIAPPATHFKRYEWSGELRRRDCGYALQVYTDRRDGAGDRYEIRNKKPHTKCPSNRRAQSSGFTRPASYPVGNDQSGPDRIVQRIDCRSRDGCLARGENYVRTFKGSAEVVDYTPPSVQITGGGLASGSWVRGDQVVEYTASDNVGVREATVLAGNSPQRPVARPCDHTRLVPCVNGAAVIATDTTKLVDGSQALSVEAHDSASNPGRSQVVTARVDNSAPGSVDVAVEGGEQWRSTPNFMLTWTNPQEVDRAPIAAAHYIVCQSGARECPSSRANADGIDRLAVTAPSPGEHTASVWREDAAGNHKADNASVEVALRYDPESPKPAFEPLTPSDPTRISVVVEDKVSGLAGGTIEISRSGADTWQALPTGQEGERLVSRVDDSRFPPGDYVLRADAFDQARNEGSTDRRVDGRPMTITLPLRVAARMRAGVARRKVVRRRAGRRGNRRTVRRRITVLDARRRVRFGRPISITGRLTNSDGQGIPGAQVQVFSSTRVTPEASVGAIGTDRKGRYRYRARAASTSTLRFAYAGTELILPAERKVTLLVPAASTMRVSRRRVRNGQSVSFTGRLGAPAVDKLVELQVRLSGRFQTFRTTRTDSQGRWSVDYRFLRTCGLTRFDFRARLPKESGYPFETGRSRTVPVTVRGVPCGA